MTAFGAILFLTVNYCRIAFFYGFPPKLHELEQDLMINIARINDQWPRDLISSLL